MKNELLARAISELDDDLIEEARRPVLKSRLSFPVISRFAAIAACLAIIVAAAFGPLRTQGELSVSISGAEISADETVSIPLVAPMQLRTVPGTEIPLTISAAGKNVSVYAGSGSVLFFGDSKGVSEITLSEDTELIWLVDITSRSNFELTITQGSSSTIITAAVSPGEDALIITAER